MKKVTQLLILTLIVTIMAACSDKLPELTVDFDPQENIEIGETVELKATVKYDKKLVKDANEVNFEYWEGDDKENSITVDSTNNKDGTYTAEITLENEGVYYVYAHTTARSLHTMPKRRIIVGDPEIPEEDNHNNDNHDEHNH